MRLKTFYANTMTEAMQMIRETLGDEAVIVATGDEPARGGVRVTAAIEPAFEIGDEEEKGLQNWLQYDEEQDTDAVAEEITEIMLRHCVPEEIMDHIISCTTVMGFDDVATALDCSLEQLFSFRPLPSEPYQKPMMMIGPPGSGKTLAVAKIAARGVMNGLKVGVISTDTVRAGGVEQLEAFTSLLNIRLRKVDTPQRLRAAVEELTETKDQVVIDTSGFNPFSTDDVKVIAKLIGAVNPRTTLVLNAGMDADEAGEMARVFATIGATEILPTRVDIARRLGNLLSAAHQGGLSFTDVSATPKVADGLAPLTPKSLARLLVPQLYQSQKDDIMQSRPLSNRVRKTGTRQ